MYRSQFGRYRGRIVTFTIKLLDRFNAVKGDVVTTMDEFIVYLQKSKAIFLAEI